MARRIRPGKILVYAVVLLGAALVLLPMYLTVVTAFKTPQEISRSFFALPKSFYLENFRYILNRSDFMTYVRNSLVVTVSSVGLIVAVTPAVSYAIARKMDTSRFYRGIYYYLLMALFVPFQVIMVPLTLVLDKLQLMNLPGLIVCYVAFSLSQAVFLYVGYLRSIPAELEEAATIDGCSVGQTYVRIIFPLLMPMTATVIILNALWIWNDFMLPLLVLNRSARMWTMPLFMFNFKNQYSFEANLAFAAFLLALLPILGLYVFMQKYIVAGLTAGAVKG